MIVSPTVVFPDLHIARITLIICLGSSSDVFRTQQIHRITYRRRVLRCRQHSTSLTGSVDRYARVLAPLGLYVNRSILLVLVVRKTGGQILAAEECGFGGEFVTHGPSTQ